MFKELILLSSKFFLSPEKSIYFIGIGGISMSGLAEMLIQHGYKVSGSDAKESDLTDKLRKMGAKVFIGQSSENIDKNISLVVYTAAISKTNPEIIEAQKLGLEMMDRAEFLGKIMECFKYNIDISGTHGKTTTTSMISCISLKAKLDPTIMVGGELDAINGNFRCGKSEYFIAESCEYKASFLKFHPYIGLILNVDEDHLDFYKDINDIQNTFSKFAHLIPNDGCLIACAEDKRALEISKSVSCRVVTYGITSGMVTAENIKYDDMDLPSFDICENGVKKLSINLSVPGRHNVLNSLGAYCASKAVGIDDKFIKEGLESFHNAHRRFEIKGKRNDVTVVDDYSHNPTEIKAALSIARNFPHKKIFCVFQPHTYSRTLSLFDGFTHAFKGVDELILADIYSAREKDTGVISSNMLGDKIRENGGNCINIHSFQEITDYLRKNASDGDLVITIGAGDIYKVSEMFLK